MAITTVCSGCKKTLKVKDEMGGKRIKCPGCGNTFVAGPAPAAKPNPWGGRGVEPAGAVAKGTPRLHLSPGVKVAIALAIILPTTFGLYRTFPGATMAEWEEKKEQASSEVGDVVAQILKSYMSEHGGFDPKRAHRDPHMINVEFAFGPMRWTMPDHIGFAGTSSEGIFGGVYHPKTGEIKVDVEVGGSTLSTGIVVRRGDKSLKGTGRVKNGMITAEIDGKPATITTRPSFDDL